MRSSSVLASRRRRASRPLAWSGEAKGACHRALDDLRRAGRWRAPRSSSSTPRERLLVSLAEVRSAIDANDHEPARRAAGGEGRPMPPPAGSAPRTKPPIEQLEAEIDALKLAGLTPLPPARTSGSRRTTGDETLEPAETAGSDEPADAGEAPASGEPETAKFEETGAAEAKPEVLESTIDRRSSSRGSSVRLLCRTPRPAFPRRSWCRSRRPTRMRRSASSASASSSTSSPWTSAWPRPCRAADRRSRRGTGRGTGRRGGRGTGRGTRRGAGRGAGRHGGRGADRATAIGSCSPATRRIGGDCEVAVDALFARLKAAATSTTTPPSPMSRLNPKRARQRHRSPTSTWPPRPRRTRRSRPMRRRRPRPSRRRPTPCSRPAPRPSSRPRER